MSRGRARKGRDFFIRKMKYNQEDSMAAGDVAPAQLPGEGDYSEWTETSINELLISTTVNRSNERWAIKPTPNKG